MKFCFKWDKRLESFCPCLAKWESQISGKVPDLSHLVWAGSTVRITTQFSGTCLLSFFSPLHVKIIDRDELIFFWVPCLPPTKKKLSVDLVRQQQQLPAKKRVPTEIFFILSSRGVVVFSSSSPSSSKANTLPKRQTSTTTYTRGKGRHKKSHTSSLVFRLPSWTGVQRLFVNIIQASPLLLLLCLLQ